MEALPLCLHSLKETRTNILILAIWVCMSKCLLLQQKKNITWNIQQWDKTSKYVQILGIVLNAVLTTIQLLYLANTYLCLSFLSA